jgi:hypothetical protein
MLWPDLSRACACPKRRWPGKNSYQLLASSFQFALAGLSCQDSASKMELKAESCL